MSLPGDPARSDCLLGYKCDITPPLLLLLKKILPEIKSSSQLSTQCGKRTPPPKKSAFSVPGAQSPVIKSSSPRRGTRGTVTPSLNEPVTYPASVCCLLSKEGSAHISGFHFPPLSLPYGPSSSLVFKLQSAVLKRLPESAWKGARGWRGGDGAKPHPKLFSTPVQSLSRWGRLHSSAGPPASQRARPRVRPSVRPPARGAGPGGMRVMPRPAPRRALLEAPTGDGRSCPGPTLPASPAASRGASAAREAKHCTGSPAGALLEAGSLASNLRHRISLPNRLGDREINSQLQNVPNFSEISLKKNNKKGYMLLCT